MTYRQQFFLLQELARRDFQGRYAGSVLGFVWSFAQPLWLLLLFQFVFATVLQISPIGERTESFAVFLFCGLLPWMAIHEGITRSSTAITDNANLVKKLQFPAELLILGIILAALAHQAIGTGLFLGVLAVLGEFHLRGLPLLLLALPLQLALTVGLALLLSAVHVFFRDTAQIIGMLLNGWFYVTPIVYPLGLVPDRYVGWIELNPLTALVELNRRALLGGDLQTVPGTGALALFALVSMTLGIWLFRRLKPAFVDEI